jgi:2-polyprenyl-3-methyl-5-hydroxy-6-metoxy-1,4-benzoquinol methylase
MCRKDTQSTFSPYITYQNETYFSAFEGTVIARCNNCGILKTFPAQTNRYFDPQQSRTDFYEDNVERFSRIFKPLVATVKKYKPHGDILEVGCSSGILLSLLKDQGYMVCGVEPNKKAVDLAKKKIGPTVFHGELKAYSRKCTKQFDVVIYNHVLEHVRNVYHELVLVKKLLRKNGILIVGVPNTRNIIFAVRNKKWELLMPNEHLWQFNDRYLCNLLARFNFAVQEIQYDNDYRIEYPRFKQVFFKILILLNTFLRTGEVMIVVAQKQ